MKKYLFLILTLAGVLLISSINAVGQDVISWQDAHKYYGKYLTVEGKIVNTYNSGKACFLNFHPNWKKYFTAVIFASDFGKFPPAPEDYYYGKEVRVTGTIKEYKGKPEIILKYPSQIKIVKKELPFQETNEKYEQGFESSDLIRQYENLNEEGKKLLWDYLKFLSSRYGK